jgi:hypothetical protein
MCANGTHQQQEIDFKLSYSPTSGTVSIQITLCIAASFNLIIGIIDVVNCFQSTMLPGHERVTIMMSPRYKKGFKSRYPNVKWEESPSNKYILELLNGLQGDKSIGRKWYQEPSLFIYQQDDSTTILNTSTDDFLCAYSDTALFDKLCKWLERFFKITTNTGSLLKYLNLCII